MFKELSISAAELMDGSMRGCMIASRAGQKWEKLVRWAGLETNEALQ